MFVATGVRSARRIPAVRSNSSSSVENVPLSVVGAHLSGLALNHQLTDLGATLSKSCKTAPVYRFYDITKPGDKVARPGLVRVKTAETTKGEGVAIETEVWSVPVDKLGVFMNNGLKPPLTVGLVELDDGSKVFGFLCEGIYAETSKDISNHGGWRSYTKKE